MAHELIDGLTGWFLGYDPGGNDSHGVAAIRVECGRIERPTVATRPAVADVLCWFQDQSQEWNKEGPLSGVLGVGIDTLAYWSVASNGARSADNTLRSKYPDVKGSVLWPNALRSAMSVNGMLVLRKLREQCSSVYVTETHPKVLYRALSRKPYGGPPLNDLNRRIDDLTTKRKGKKGDEKARIDSEISRLRRQRPKKEKEGRPFMNEWLSRVLDVPSTDASIGHLPRLDSDGWSHEWDALISAWAAYQGYESARGRADWKNLVDCDSASNLDFPAGGVEYRWPGEEEVAAVKERLGTPSDEPEARLR